MPPSHTHTTRQWRGLFPAGRYFAIIAALGVFCPGGVLAEPSGRAAARIEIAEQFVRDLAGGRAGAWIGTARRG